VDSGGSARYFYHQNTLFSVCAVTDSSGKIVEAYEYDPYGRHVLLRDGNADGRVNFDSTDFRLSSGGSSILNPQTQIGNPNTFTGQRFDPETGLHNYKERYYSCTQGRFINEDPIGYPGGVNIYEYVNGAPLSTTDPLGYAGLITRMHLWVFMAHYISDMRYDPGWWYAEALMWHYINGDGEVFLRQGGAWAGFMKSRPELRIQVHEFLAKKVKELCWTNANSAKTSGKINESTPAILYRLPSMLFTLHGAESLIMKDDYEVERPWKGEGKDLSCDCRVKFRNVTWVWKDRGDFHAGISTALKSGGTVDDKSLEAVGKALFNAKPYEIRITWRGDSEWSFPMIGGGKPTILSGWPTLPTSIDDDPLALGD